MKKITVIELVNTVTNESLGYAPVIEEKGKKSIMIVKDQKPLTFKTKKEAKSYGLKKISGICKFHEVCEYPIDSGNTCVPLKGCFEHKY